MNVKISNIGSKEQSFGVSLANKRRILPVWPMEQPVNAYMEYLNEREACDTYRFTIQINPVCSNILFNSLTEIVKNEGSSDVECLNIKPKAISTSIGKTSTYSWGSDMAMCTMDTQISYSGDENKNYTYHCGIDIFNNHILRNSSFIPVSDPNNASINIGNDFNTLNEYIRDACGMKPVNALYKKKVGNEYMHLFTKKETDNFYDCISDKLSERNGWLGFKNKAKMTTFSQSGEDLGISRVINNKGTNDFIDMYPGRELYKFTPIYNKYKGRVEKNWEYCLTYPYSSTTEGINFIETFEGTELSGTTALKIGMIDEQVRDDDGISKTIIYSISQHGLKEDDLINIYKTYTDSEKHAELVSSEVVVTEVIDEFTFAIYSDEIFCNKWVDSVDVDVMSYYGVNESANTFSESGSTYNSGDTYNVNGRYNCDYTSLSMSFAKIEDNEQVEYYVRLFSRVPNFKSLPEGYTQENADNSIEECSLSEKELQSHFTRLGFARNAYNDEMAQIAYTDDVHLKYIKDNLGRPLSTLYLSIFKTNYGYKEWYAHSAGTNEYKSDNVEFSHCFGKLTCGFELSPYTPSHFKDMANAYKLGIESGLTITDSMKANGYSHNAKDEVDYKNMKIFYGDLCEYSETNCKEVVIQTVCNRFNTAQRDITNMNKLDSDFNDSWVNKKRVEWHNLISDDFDSSNFGTSVEIYDNEPYNKPEGYYYKAHYPIYVRKVSDTVSTSKSYSYNIVKFDKETENNCISVITKDDNYIETGDMLMLYDKSNNRYYSAKAEYVYSTNKIRLFLTNIDGSSINNDVISSILENKTQSTSYLLLEQPKNIPSYAKLSTDGSCQYKWREIFQNGLENNDEDMIDYPFTNGALYVNARLDLFLKRQDPFGSNGLLKTLGVDIIDGQNAPKAVEDEELFLENENLSEC